ncbi:unnamed protein product, partial [Rotaria sp. Silwood2]
MGHCTSCTNIRFCTRIHVFDSPEIPIHYKCRNCGQHCDQSKSSDACIYAKFTRTGTKEQPTIIRAVVPNDKVLWSTSFDYHPIEFTSEK